VLDRFRGALAGCPAADLERSCADPAGDTTRSDALPDADAGEHQICRLSGRRAAS